MKTMKLTSIAIVICFLCLFGITVKSEAASITSFSIPSSYDYGSGANFWASLSTDADIYFISFSVKQTYPTADDDWTIIYSNMYATGTRSIYENIGSVTGHIKIAEYQAKAEVWFYDADGNPTNDSDTSTTTVSAYKPDINSGPQNGVWGTSELTAHYFDGSSIVMDGYIFAYHHDGRGGIGGRDRTSQGSGRFRHFEQNTGKWFEEDAPNVEFKTYTAYYSSTSDWPHSFSFPTGGAIERGVEWDCTTYLRLNANQDTWLVEGRNVFTEADNR